MKILGGILISVSGVVLIKYCRQLVMWFGEFDFAEKYLGAGGTYNFYRLIGVVLFFAGILYMFGKLG